MKILYGTTNKAKLQAMRTALEAFDIELIGLADIDSELPSINENGKTPLENAEIKAREYYASLAAMHGGRITGRYRNAIYFIMDEEYHYSSMDMSIATEPFILVTEPHPKWVEGFPLDSLSVDIATGKYYYDLDVKDVSTSVDDGVRAFFGVIEQLK